jgi:tRNA wybutosine-synthesizing protein 3
MTYEDVVSHLRPDHDDDPRLLLPSFASIRHRTLETLRSDGGAPTTTTARLDKSPKGSVDAPVRGLVDLINLHPSFATLSSCSGRISLFDPNLQGETIKFDLMDPVDIVHDGQPAIVQGKGSTDTFIGSGKGGGGGWLLVSHKVISDPKTLIELLDSDPVKVSSAMARGGRLLAFKMEPMLLHVAAATLERGQQLLQVALRAGFRESGLVVTPNRVSVAIRSYSLSLSVPLSRRGSLRPPDSYLTKLVEEANRRLAANLSRIEALQREIEQELFQREPNCEPSSPRRSSEFLNNAQQGSCTVDANRIPDLNLWGHSTVTVDDDEAGSVSILSFGGYGAGPPVLTSNPKTADSTFKSSQRPGCRRSDEIYRLKRRLGTWGHFWERLELGGSHEGENQVGGLRIRFGRADFGPREGLASCIVASQAGETWIALFGGRMSPARPIGELLIASYLPSRRTIAVNKPLDVRGRPPSPRWGHSLTALAGTGHDMELSRLAVLVGGRNETQVLDSMFLLSASRDGADRSEGESHFVWEKLVVSSEQQYPGRFHHACALHRDQLFVFGGLTSTSNLLEAFGGDSSLSESPNVFGFTLDITTCPVVASPIAVDADEPSQRRFGHKVSILATTRDEAIVALTGGVPISDREKELIRPVDLACIIRVSPSGMVDRRVKIQPFRSVSWEDEADPNVHPTYQRLSVDFGTLVHHDACVVSTNTQNVDGDDVKKLELVVTGGGVPGFGFSPCYASSYALSIAFAPPRASSRSASDADAVQGSSHVPGKASKSPLARLSSAGKGLLQSTMTSSPTLDERPISVAYVKKSDAKRIKTLFQERGWLELNYRMGPADSCDLDLLAGCIALPLSASGCQALDQQEQGNDDSDAAAEWWRSTIVGRGEQRLPRSTRTYASSSRGVQL